MADVKISQLPPAEELTGDELAVLVQDGVTVQSTAQAIADLASGGFDPASNQTITGLWQFSNAAGLQLVGVQPRLFWNETDGALDTKIWDEIINSGTRMKRILNDAQNAGLAYYSETRTADDSILMQWVPTLGTEITMDVNGLTLNSGLQLIGEVTDSIAVQENNYAPTGLGNASILKIDASEPSEITGIETDDFPSGKVVYIINTGTESITLVNQSGDSSVGNQFDIGSNIVLGAGHAVGVVWDDPVWRRLSNSEGSGGGSTPMARGVIENGELQFGTGIASVAWSCGNPGLFDITFEVGFFSGSVVAVATIINPVENPDLIIQTSSVGSSGMTVEIRNLAGDQVDSPFSIIVVQAVDS